MAESNKTAVATEAEIQDPSEQTERPETRDYIQFMGDELHGTAFLSSHTIPKGDGLWKRARITVPKDLVWERDPTGPAVGFKGNKMLLAVEDIPTEAVTVLEKTPGYKRVTE